MHFKKITETLGTVHTCGMGLLRGLRWPLGRKLVFEQIAAPVPEIVDISGMVALNSCRILGALLLLKCVQMQMQKRCDWKNIGMGCLMLHLSMQGIMLSLWRTFAFLMLKYLRAAAAQMV
jgi:hypothetical protein